MKTLKHVIGRMTAITLLLGAGTARADFIDPCTVAVPGFASIDCATRDFAIQSSDVDLVFDDTNNLNWSIAPGEAGADTFVIQDDNGTSIFVMEQGSTANALRIDSAGDVGIGTATPSQELHVIGSIRIDNGAADAWDMDSFSTGLRIRRSGGAAQPVFIEDDAPSNSLFLDDTGQVGLGTSATSAPLEVLANPGTIGVGNAVIKLTNPGDLAVQLDNTSAVGFWNFSNANAESEFRISRSGTGAQEMILTASGDLTITGNLVTGGGGTCDPGPCDLVFDPSVYQVPSIEEHAKLMWENKHLPIVGPTKAGEPINVTIKLTRMLNELETAHIYIAELNGYIADLNETNGQLAQEKENLQGQLATLESRLARVEALLGQ